MTKISASKFLFCALACIAGAYPALGQSVPRRISPQNAPLADALRRTIKVPGPDAATALRKFERKTGTQAWRVRYSPKTAMPEAIMGARTNRYPGGPTEAAPAFLNENKDLLKVDVAQLRLAYSKTFMGITHLQYDQVYNSIPVEFAYVRVHVNSSGEVIGYQSKFEPVIDVPLTPVYPLAQAENVVLADLGFSGRVTKTRLVLFPDPAADGALKLAWKIRTRAATTGNGIWIYYIGAADGGILFRYNDLRYAASGNVHGLVYPISPLPTGTGSWITPLDKPIKNQYVWVTNTLAASSRTVSDAAGDYLSNYDGKVFASLKGPYFSVVNFLGPSAHFDNGGGVWTTYYHTPSVGGTSTSDNSYSVSIPQSHWPATSAFAKVLPHFASFNVGAMDNDGDFSNEDELNVLDGSSVVASYVGSRTAPFFGAPVENPTYGLGLDKRSGSGTSASFAVDFSSYLVLANAPTVTDNTNGSINWVSTGTGVSIESFGNAENSQAEVNVFYNLNSIYDYFTFVNIDPNNPQQTPADLSSKQVPVMVHACDTSMDISNGGLRNAFYDLEQDNIFIGDGSTISGPGSKYLSFALDGTIIRHEYVHRVINQIYPIINIGEFGALSESLADYFALSSLDNREGNGDISVLGNFVGSPRDISGTDAVMPGSWSGEVHDDSLILSQALWTLKKSPDFVGNYADFPGVDRMDVLTYATLFYFPDNFANFYDAMLDACRQLGGGTCAYESTLSAAFAAHGIPGYSNDGDAYDQPVAGTLCANNNGPECATDVSQISSLSATIFPNGDSDFYSIPLSKGNFTAVLTLPAADSNYQSYSMGLFDAARNHITDVSAPASNSSNGVCPLNGVCLTNDQSLVLSQTIDSPGRYYLVVTGGNADTFSSASYSLALQYMSTGSAQAGITHAVFDGDNITFSVPYARFLMRQAPSSSTLTGAESVFQYAQLRDGIDHHPLADARTDVPGSYLTAGAITQTESGYIQGNASLAPGFNTRYPAIGPVCLEVFGRNHMGSIVSLGVSNPFSLTTNRCDLITYNNVLAGDNPAAAKIRYDVTLPGELSIKIYSVSGTLVRTIYDGLVEAGKGAVSWDGKNDEGSKAASGIYYIKASGPSCNKVDKIAVVR